MEPNPDPKNPLLTLVPVDIHGRDGECAACIVRGVFVCVFVCVCVCVHVCMCALCVCTCACVGVSNNALDKLILSVSPSNLPPKIYSVGVIHLRAHNIAEMRAWFNALEACGAKFAKPAPFNAAPAPAAAAAAPHMHAPPGITREVGNDTLPVVSAASANKTSHIGTGPYPLFYLSR